MSKNKSDENCYICYNKIRIYTITKCGHTLCHRCFIRIQRSPIGQRCKFCRDRINEVIFSKQLKPYSSFKRGKLCKFYRYECYFYCDSEVKKEVDKVWCFQCPIKDCKKQFAETQQFPEVACDDFTIHLKKHNLYCCKTCYLIKRPFPNEVTIYNHDDFKKHDLSGDCWL